MREKAAGSLPPAPPGQTGNEEEEEEWRGRGEEVSPADRRGEGAARGKAGAARGKAGAVHSRKALGDTRQGNARGSGAASPSGAKFRAIWVGLAGKS